MKLKNIACAAFVILLVSVFLGCTGKEQPEPAEKTGEMEKGMDMGKGMDMEQARNPIDRTVSGLDKAKAHQIIELSDGSVFLLEAKPVVKNVNGNAMFTGTV